MTERLRELLEDASAQAPAVRLREDTWRRARRTRAVELVAPVLAVAVLVLGGLALVSPGGGAGRGAAPADTGARQPALPTTLYEVPAHVDAGDDLAVGQLSIAWATDSTDEVVGVRAQDGAYRLLDLPGYETEPGSFMSWAQRFALSPDGLHLAYAWRGPADQERGVVPGGYAVLDLTTGDIDRHELDEGAGVELTALAWSADGTHLSYRVHVWDTLDAGGGQTGGTPDRWEVVDPGTGRGLPWQEARWWVVAPTHEGTGLVAAEEERVVELEPSGRVRELARLPSRAVALVDTAQGLVALTPEATFLVRDGEIKRVHRRGLHVEGTIVAGTAERILTVDRPHGPAELVEQSSIAGPVSSLLRIQPLFAGHNDEYWMTSISAAQDLVAAPRRDFGEPDWPVDPRLYLLGGAAALVALGALLVWWRRQQG